MEIDNLTRIELVGCLEVLKSTDERTISKLRQEHDKSTDDFMMDNLEGAIRVYELHILKCERLLERLS